jgi:hypothetical protein
MSSIIRRGDTYHGISVFGRGVFTYDEHDNYGRTYAGQCKDGYACGLGVATYSGGSKEYAEHGPDGQFDGRWLYRSARYAYGGTNYGLFERGERKEYADVHANGDCYYNGEACAPDDPRLLALIAQVAPVEVRPAAPAPLPPLDRHSPPSNRPMDRPARFAAAGARDRRGHRGDPPFCTPSLLAVRRSPTAAALSPPVPSKPPLPPPPSPPGAFLAGLCSFAIPCRFGQAEEAVANLPLRLAVRARCGQPSLTGSQWGTEEAFRGDSRSTHGVL